MLIWLLLVGCDPNRPGMYNPNSAASYSSSDYEPEIIRVSGEVRYNSVRQNGVRLFLVNDDFEVIDDDVNDSTSVYQLDADEPADYWLLGVYAYGSTPLMASERIELTQSDEPLEENLELQTIDESPAQEYLRDPDCYCSASVWYLTYWNCEMESGWAWSECD